MNMRYDNPQLGAAENGEKVGCRNLLDLARTVSASTQQRPKVDHRPLSTFGSLLINVGNLDVPRHSAAAYCE